MRRLLWLGFLIAGATLSMGCVDNTRRRVVGTDDVVPPGEPRDVHSVTGDGQVILYWSPPRDSDLAGFSIFISQDDVDYYLVAEVSASRRHLVVDGDAVPDDVPFRFVNGNTYFLGVSAFDMAGNESELSEGATTFDTPRPSGRDLRLYRADGPRADESGYDFSRSPYGYPTDSGNLFVDVYFTYAGGRPVMRTPYPLVVEIEDKGLLDFDGELVGWLAEGEWNPSPEVVLHTGHVYLVKIFEETRPGNAFEPFNVAKFQVVSLGTDSVAIDWAYQIAPNNRELKPGKAAPAPRGSRKREVHR